MGFWKCLMSCGRFIYLNPDCIVAVEEHSSNKDVVLVMTKDGGVYSIIKEDIIHRIKYIEIE